MVIIITLREGWVRFADLVSSSRPHTQNWKGSGDFDKSLVQLTTHNRNLHIPISSVISIANCRNIEMPLAAILICITHIALLTSNIWASLKINHVGMHIEPAKPRKRPKATRPFSSWGRDLRMTLLSNRHETTAIVRVWLHDTISI